MLVLKKGVLKSFRLPEVFEESSEPVNSSGKEEYELAKQGIVSSEILHLTKQHRQGREKIQSFLKNPLMPKEIQDLLNEILYDIHYNLCCPLRQELEKFIVYICSSEVVETRFPLRMNYTTLLLTIGFSARVSVAVPRSRRLRYQKKILNDRQAMEVIKLITMICMYQSIFSLIVLRKAFLLATRLFLVTR